MMTEVHALSLGVVECDAEGFEVGVRRVHVREYEAGTELFRVEDDRRWVAVVRVGSVQRIS